MTRLADHFRALLQRSRRRRLESCIRDLCTLADQLGEPRLAGELAAACCRWQESLEPPRPRVWNPRGGVE